MKKSLYPLITLIGCLQVAQAANLQISNNVIGSSANMQLINEPTARSGNWQEQVLIFNNLPTQVKLSLDINKTHDMTTDSPIVYIPSGQAQWLNVVANAASNNPQITWNIAFGGQSAQLIYKNTVAANSRTADISVTGITYRSACDDKPCPTTIQEGGYIFVNLGPDTFKN